MWKRTRRHVLRGFAAAERPAAWGQMIAGAVVFVGVMAHLIDAGEFRLGTLILAANLVTSGFTAVQEAEDDEETPP